MLFSGTPCQVAGLYAVLGNAVSADLFTVDIVCHGTPSVKVFEKYVREMEKTDDSVHHGCSKYMRLFLSRICQNTSCDDCHYRKLPRIADITLGDYWGISRYHPEMNDNKGTSVVLLNTEHGKALFESVAGKVAQCDFKVEYAIAGNPSVHRTPSVLNSSPPWADTPLTS